MTKIKLTVFIFALLILPIMQADANGLNYQIIKPTQPPPQQQSTANIFDGFYLGAGLNFNATTGDMTQNIHDHVYNLLSQTSSQSNFPFGSYDLGLTGFAGYGRQIGSGFYLGAELLANYAPMDTVAEKITISSQTSESGKITSDYLWGGALRVGYLLSNRAMLYALIGADYSKFKIESSKVYPSFSKSVIGFMPGIGLDVMLYKNLALRTQYIYTKYPSITDTQKNETYKYKVARNMFTLGLAYYFNSPGAPEAQEANNEADYYPADWYERSALDGFYLGIGPNLASVTGKQSMTEFFHHYNETLDIRHQPGSYDLGGTALFGYGDSYKQKFYVSSELFANYFPMQIKYTLNIAPFSSVKPSIKSDYSYGAALRAGYLVSKQVLIYVLAGVDVAPFKVRSRDGSGNWPPGYKENNYFAPEYTKTLFGFMPGIGIEAAISKNLSLRAQYTYSFYPEFATDPYINDAASSNYAITESPKYDLDRSLFTFVLAYHFDN